MCKPPSVPKSPTAQPKSGDGEVDVLAGGDGGAVVGGGGFTRAVIAGRGQALPVGPVVGKHGDGVSNDACGGMGLVGAASPDGVSRVGVVVAVDVDGILRADGEASAVGEGKIGADGQVAESAVHESENVAGAADPIVLGDPATGYAAGGEVEDWGRLRR